MPARFSVAVAALLALGLVQGQTSRSASQAPAPVRIVAIGDVHGDFDAFVHLLQDAGVINGRRQWAGGRTHLVQTGDVVDRGPHSRRILDLLMTLERQAARAGGTVHALLGNHEVMNIAGDLRYVSPEEFAAFRTANSATLRETAFERLADPERRDESGYRKAWMDEHPLGWVEHRLAFGTEGKYGQWLRTHDVATIVGDTLFLHGGVSPTYATATVAHFNETVRAELADLTTLVDGMALDLDGPLWYRGLATEPEAQLSAHVDAVLGHHRVSRIVVGHTVTPGVILPRFDGKVLLIDVGIAEPYGGRRAALVIEEGFAFARHRGTPLKIGTGPDLLAYLRGAAALDPVPSPVQPLIANGGRFPLASTSEAPPQ